MNVQLTIKEIETYLELYPLEANNTQFTLPDNAIISKSHYELNGSVLLVSESSVDNQNSQLIENLLSHCDDSALDRLIDEYGEDSAVGRMIKKKRASNYIKYACTTDILEYSLVGCFAEAKRANPFYDAVILHMEQKGFKTDSEFYKKIKMPRQLFAKIRDNSNNFSKKTVLWIVVGLELDYAQANDLIQKAGYTLRNNDLRDVVLSYIFRNTRYTLKSVNEVLEHFNLETFC